jgi:hypothetical protein
MTAQLLRSLKRDQSSTLELPQPLLHTEAAYEYSLSRTDIDFFSIGDRVTIDVKVTNSGAEPAPAGTALVQAAPFGAFVPWRPLAVLPVPPLAPGEEYRLRTHAVAEKPTPLGDPGRVPPRQLLTALGMFDDRSGDRGTRARAPLSMPPDPMQLLLQDNPHWVGNINVLVGPKDVERHLARALRIYPGRANMAWFCVGSWGRDAYAFWLKGLQPEWHASLFDMSTRESLVLGPEDGPEIVPERWIPTESTHVMMLVLTVPAACGAGNVEVHVRQRSTGRHAVVEFSLDPEAAGRGCYAV